MTAVMANPLPESLERDLLSIMGLDALPPPAAAPLRRRTGAARRTRPDVRALLSSRAASASISVAAVVAALGFGAALVLNVPESGGGETAAPAVSREIPPSHPVTPAPAAVTPREAFPAAPASRPSDAPDAAPERVATARPAIRPRPAERVRVAAHAAPAPPRPAVDRPAPVTPTRLVPPEPVVFASNRAQPETLALGRGPQPAATAGYVNSPAQPETVILGRIAAARAAPDPASAARERPERAAPRDRRDSVDALMTLRRQW